MRFQFWHLLRRRVAWLLLGFVLGAAAVAWWARNEIREIRKILMQDDRRDQWR